MFSLAELLDRRPDGIGSVEHMKFRFEFDGVRSEELNAFLERVSDWRKPLARFRSRRTRRMVNVFDSVIVMAGQRSWSSQRLADA